MPSGVSLTGKSRTVEVLIDKDVTQTSTTTYRVELETVDDRIVVTCVDLQGVVTDGANEKEAMSNAYEAVEAYLESQGKFDKFILVEKID